MGMLPVQGDAGFHEGGQYVHLTEVDPLPFEPDPRNPRGVPLGPSSTLSLPGPSHSVGAQREADEAVLVRS